MSGYLGDPPQESQNRVLTGDLEEIDDDGFVYVRGRTRNIFITSLGRNAVAGVGGERGWLTSR